MPDLPQGNGCVLLLMPCTKTKPHVFSTEHKRINQALLVAGCAPVQDMRVMSLADRLEPEFMPEVLNLAPLQRRGRFIVNRAIISEPLGFAPYEHMLGYPDGASPATAYDGPGLFENRSNAVAPWRSDFTSTRVSATHWPWEATSYAAT